MVESKSPFSIEGNFLFFNNQKMSNYEVFIASTLHFDFMEKIDKDVIMKHLSNVRREN